MQGRGKEVLNFLLLKPAFTGRNLFSIFLVMLFVGVYIASGGRVHSLPKVKPGSQFGAVDSPTSGSTVGQVPPSSNKIQNIFGSSPEKRDGAARDSAAQDSVKTEDNQDSPAARLEKLRKRLEQQNKR